MPKGVGDRVRRGELLVRFEIPSLDADAAARRSDLARGQAQLATARQNAARLSGLFQRGIAARKEVEDAQRDLAPGGGDRDRGPERDGGRRPARRARGGARALRRRRRRPLASGGGHRRSGGPEPLLRVIDPSRLQVEAAVPAGELGRIAVGSPARVRGAGFPDEAARVVARPAAVDPATGTALARLAFDAPTRRPAGLAVEVEIYGEEHPAAVLVPAEALVQEGPESFVFTVDAPEEGPPPQGGSRQ